MDVDAASEAKTEQYVKKLGSCMQSFSATTAWRGDGAGVDRVETC